MWYIKHKEAVSDRVVVRGQISSLSHRKAVKTFYSDNKNFDIKIGCSPISSSMAATHFGKVSRKDQVKIKCFSAFET